MPGHRRPQVGNGGRVSGGSSAPGCRPGHVCTGGQLAVEAEVHGRRLRLERVEWPPPPRSAAGGVPVRRLSLREAAATAPRSPVAMHATGGGEPHRRASEGHQSGEGIETYKTYLATDAVGSGGALAGSMAVGIVQHYLSQMPKFAAQFKL